MASWWRSSQNNRLEKKPTDLTKAARNAAQAVGENFFNLGVNAFDLSGVPFTEGLKPVVSIFKIRDTKKSIQYNIQKLEWINKELDYLSNIAKEHTFCIPSKELKTKIETYLHALRTESVRAVLDSKGHVQSMNDRINDVVFDFTRILSLTLSAFYYFNSPIQSKSKVELYESLRRQCQETQIQKKITGNTSNTSEEGLLGNRSK